jgi:hypothetical protein
MRQRILAPSLAFFCGWLMLSAVALAQPDSTQKKPYVPPMPKIEYPVASAPADSGLVRSPQGFEQAQMTKFRASRDFEYDREA